MGAVESPTRLALTVEQYEKMWESDVFEPDARIELIDGVIYQMPPIGSPHHAVVMRLNQLFCTRLAGRATVSPQGALRLPPDSYPQPDLQLLAPRTDFYAGANPRAPDVLLLIEVAASSLRFDRTVKLPMYARRGVEEVWIVDVAGRRLEVARSLAQTACRECFLVGEGGDVAPAAFPDCTVRWDDVFG